MFIVEKPGIENIQQTLINHYKYYYNIGAETCNQQKNSEREIGQQYSGRAIYELLQNALDYCSQNVAVAVDKSSTRDYFLLVGNDGKRLSVNPNHDYNNPDNSSKRSDFHALCSIHTSNKRPDENIGHKGIGFKAVFSLTNMVQVWSRIDCPYNKYKWWGIELHKELNYEIFRQRLETQVVNHGTKYFLNSDVLESVSHKLNHNTVPSFYFPLPLLNSELPVNIPDINDSLANMETLVILPLSRENEDTIDLAEKYLIELQQTHFYFISLRRKNNIQITIYNGEINENKKLPTTPQKNDNTIMAKWSSKELTSLANYANLNLSNSCVSVLLHDNNNYNYFYCYLPTSKKGAFNVDINGDFYIGIDRTNIPIREGRIGDYNKALLEASTELHLLIILYTLNFEADTIKNWVQWRWIKDANFEILHCPNENTKEVNKLFQWRYLDPNTNKSEEAEICISHIGKLLFPQKENKSLDYSRWVDLAVKYFNSKVQRNLACYKEFWEVSANWLSYLCPHSKSSKTWRKNFALAFCNDLREKEAMVVPIINTATKESEDPLIEKSMTLPDRMEKGEGARANKRLFLRKIEDKEPNETKIIKLPQALLEKGRAVTTFEFPEGFTDTTYRPTGAVDMERWTLLNELRQLPLSESNLNEISKQKSKERPYEILRFAAQLLSIKFGDKSPPVEQDNFKEISWRFHIRRVPDDARRAGKALATLFLPTKEGKWEPARQLTIDQVDREDLSKNLFNEMTDISINNFLYIIGVSPLPKENGLLLVEGGNSGIVTPQDYPPPLVNLKPGSGIKKAQIVFLNQNKNDKNTAEAVKKSWKWLSPIVNLEKDHETEEKDKSDDNTFTLESEVKNTLLKENWFPVAPENKEEVNKDFANRPVGLNKTVNFIAPEKIVLQPEKGDVQRFKILWGVRRDSEYKDILESLGVIRGLHEDYLEAFEAEPAKRLVEHIKELDIYSINKDNQAKLGMIALYRHLFEVLVKNNKRYLNKIPMLLFEGYSSTSQTGSLGDRALIWSDEKTYYENNKEWWIAEDEAQQKILERFYPNINLAVPTTISKNLKDTEIEQHSIKAISKIKTNDELSESKQLNKEIKDKLETLLPGLLALAQLFPQQQKEVDAEAVMENWKKLNFNFYTEVFEEISTIPYLGEPKKWRKDVLFTTDNETLSDLNIYVKASQGKRDFPLRYFASGLAIKLLDNRLLEGPWGQALTEYDTLEGNEEEKYQQFRDHLEKNWACNLEKEYKRKINPLSKEEEKIFKNTLAKALKSIGCCLKDGESDYFELKRLNTEKISSLKYSWQDLTENEVQKAIDNESWPMKNGIEYKPYFECSTLNKIKWKNWLESSKGKDMKTRLILAVLNKNSIEQDKEEKELENDLDSYIEENLKYLDFSPEKTAKGWLKKHGKDFINNYTNIPLEDLLPVTNSFKRINKFISNAPWKPVKIDPHTLKETPLNPGEYNSQAKILKGEEAEEVFCEYVANQIQNIILNREEEAWNIMLKHASNKKLRDNLIEAKDSQDCSTDSFVKLLKRAIKVSNYWGNAGFDILGLEESNNSSALKVALYEVKAIPYDTRARLHISNNQLQVYRKYATKKEVSWKLIGVTPNETAYDLTDYLETLRNYIDQGIFNEFYNQGFMPKTFTLTIDPQK